GHRMIGRLHNPAREAPDGGFEQRVVVVAVADDRRQWLDLHVDVVVVTTGMSAKVLGDEYRIVEEDAANHGLMPKGAKLRAGSVAVVAGAGMSGVAWR